MESQFFMLLASAAPRRWWSRAPQIPAPQRPYVVMHRISDVRGYHMQGPDGLVESRIQIDVYGDDRPSTRAMADAIIATLSGYRGGDIRGIFIENERNFPMESSDPSELHRISIDVIVWHRE